MPQMKVALNTLILSNVEALSARLFNCNVFLAKLQYSDVFWATFLPGAYLPDFDSCTKHINYWKRWSTRGIVEAESSVLLDWSLLSNHIIPNWNWILMICSTSLIEITSFTLMLQCGLRPTKGWTARPRLWTWRFIIVRNPVRIIISIGVIGVPGQVLN